MTNNEPTCTTVPTRPKWISTRNPSRYAILHSLPLVQSRLHYNNITLVSLTVRFVCAVRLLHFTRIRTSCAHANTQMSQWPLSRPTGQVSFRHKRRPIFPDGDNNNDDDDDNIRYCYCRGFTVCYDSSRSHVVTRVISGRYHRSRRSSAVLHRVTD
jgi:hypothetical protein